MTYDNGGELSNLADALEQENCTKPERPTIGVNDYAVMIGTFVFCVGFFKVFL